MSYRNLEIWEVVIVIHKMSLTLPKFEMYEEGSQILSKGMEEEIIKVTMNDTSQCR